MNRKQTSAPIRPSYESEIKDCNDIFNSIIRNIKKQPGYEVDYPLLEKAYDTAKNLHGDVRRHSGVLYLRHPLSVMESLSRLKCKTSILAAALLHDTMEDCDYTYESLRSSFKDEIAEIVSAVTAIKAAEKEAEEAFDQLTTEEKHDVLDRLTDAKLIKSGYQREAFLVRFADREHNLSTIDACKPEKRRLKIEQTKAFLIPAAISLGMRYYEVSLSNYCMKFAEDPLEYDTLLDFRNQYISVSGPVFSEFDSILQEGVNSQKFFSFPPFNPFARLRGVKKDGKDIQQLECRRLLNPYEIKGQLKGEIAFDRQDVCLNEIVLTCEEKDKSVMLSNFIEFFKKYLKPCLMFFEYSGEEEHAISIKLTDIYENNYRIVIIQDKNLETYFIGDPNGEPLTMIDEKSIADALRPKITVYAYSTYKPIRKFEGVVPQGATALDFAFIVSPALAYTVKFAKIKKWNGLNVSFSEHDYNYPLKTILEDGDVVHFEADYFPNHQYAVPHATIDWFGYINTEYAKNELISHFKRLIPKEIYQAD